MRQAGGRLTEDDSEMVFYAFRYCLGRMTYAVSTCVQYVIANWGDIRERDKVLMVREIEKAIADGHAGMAMDVAEWQKILVHAKAVSACQCSCHTTQETCDNECCQPLQRSKG